MAELLHYKNNQVVRYFHHQRPDLSFDDCQQIFQDLLAWMGIKAIRNKLGKKTYFFGPLLILDKLWHAFILHTRDYCQFCDTYFGAYLHHDIEPIGHEYHLSAKELIDFIQDCFKYLGQDWVMRYFKNLIDEQAEVE